MKSYTVPFGSSVDPNLVGGKGAALSRMVRLGLPVPPGLTIVTDAWRDIAAGQLTREALGRQALRAVREMFPAGQLVSVRSGAPVSMPGMMETILNVGALVKGTDPALLLTLYRSLASAQGVAAEYIDGLLTGAMLQAGVFFPEQLKHVHVAHLARTIRAKLKNDGALPATAAGQLKLAIGLVLDSWDSERAQLYRETHGLDREMGTAVNIQAMVFGTRGGSGVYLTRNPSTGADTPVIDWAPGHQGDVVVDGSTNTEDGDALQAQYPALYRQLREVGHLLESEMGDAQDIEFTIDSDSLFILQHRSVKRTPKAAVRIAVEMSRAGLMPAERMVRVSIPEPERAVGIAGGTLIGWGLPIVGRLVRGRVALSDEDVAKFGNEAVLFRYTTTPTDLPAMLAAQALVTLKGGPTCHAALVAREYDKPAYVQADVEIDPCDHSVTGHGERIDVGDPIVIMPDGKMYAGQPTTTEVAVPDPWGDALRAMQAQSLATLSFELHQLELSC